MKINLNVKISAGKRTEPKADVYSTSVNPKEIELKNGVRVTEYELAAVIGDATVKYLKEKELEK